MKNRMIDLNNSALLVIDIQEAFRKSIPGLDKIIARTNAAIQGFTVLDRPVLITEQYPKGLGFTVHEIKDTNSKAVYFEKSTFSACGAVGFCEYIKENQIANLAVAGIEAHVCVNQTVHELLGKQFQVHLIEDAIGSRNDVDRETAIEKMRLSGAIPSTVEMLLFELLRDSKHQRFKEIQSLIK